MMDIASIKTPLCNIKEHKTRLILSAIAISALLVKATIRVLRKHLFFQFYQVLDLYNRGRTTRDIAEELRMSLRDISVILRKNQISHGTVITNNGNGNNANETNNNKSTNEKATQAYKLFSEGKKPFEVAIELGIREAQVNKFFREFWKLNNLNQLYEIYPQIRHCLPSFLKLHKVLKTKGLTADNVEWFSDAIETGAIKIPEIEKQYAKVRDELETIDYKKTMAKYQLDDMNNRLTILNRDIYNKRNEIADLQIGVQELEEYVHRLKNHNQQQHKIPNE
jgi:DNA-binding CsgD family transcriptional regulator